MTEASKEKQFERLFVQIKALQAACPLVHVGLLATILGMIINTDLQQSHSGLVRLQTLSRLEPAMRKTADALVETFLEDAALGMRAAMVGS